MFSSLHVECWAADYFITVCAHSHTSQGVGFHTVFYPLVPQCKKTTSWTLSVWGMDRRRFLSRAFFRHKISPDPSFHRCCIEFLQHLFFCSRFNLICSFLCLQCTSSVYWSPVSSDAVSFQWIAAPSSELQQPQTTYEGLFSSWLLPLFPSLIIKRYKSMKASHSWTTSFPLLADY